MKILTVCGLGMGSSLILKMNVEAVLKQHGIQASVEHMDVSSAASANADVVITNAELVDNLKHLSCPVVVNNYIDNAEITAALTQAKILPAGEPS
ncbi:TPA: PTS sugar transporter subunit IIB [Klebsiella michiganensis]|uniref:PTS sugar transporter subunit IIB n=1 Tax=Klebsiella michiganensis TaxID=1134687 RepID=A0AB35WCT6_9ENTR|nr:PTS sugar transporter subunit IIB [Klebsiella michiganensis]MEC6051544.1 PTS sugar transporter subunit IIB [Klebsiella michiganensis]UHD06622.1 PTS sugar transporter subunit IIB [Klebsiella michiganensis]HCQ8598959.1 PTS sugar transporter subunit IIB [Klebsiella michiganensis]